MTSNHYSSSSFIIFTKRITYNLHNSVNVILWDSTSSETSQHLNIVLTWRILKFCLNGRKTIAIAVISFHPCVYESTRTTSRSFLNLQPYKPFIFFCRRYKHITLPKVEKRRNSRKQSYNEL